MNDKNQNTDGIFSNPGAGQSQASVTPFQNVSQPNSLASLPEPLQSPAAPKPPKPDNWFVRIVKRADIILAVLLILGSLGLFISTFVSDDEPTSSATGKYDTTQIPLAGLVTDQGIDFGDKSVIINGELLVNGDFVLEPSQQPSSAVAGQMYYDQTTDLLNYYNGVQFVSLSGGGTVQTVGGGLSLNAGQLSNSGVLSVQGQTGAVTLASGNGITVSGTTIAMNGNFTGNLAVSGNLSLGTPLTVASGGTGAASLTLNGVVIGQGTGQLTAVTAGGAGECLLSTAGAPAFAACPGGGGGVDSLDGLTGALTLANSSGVGTTVTIDNASTLQKGIAQFNSTNFNDNGSGTINTVQNINTGASPQFVGLTLTGDLAVNGGDITSTTTITLDATSTVIIPSADTLQSDDLTSTGLLTMTSGGGNDIVLNSADTIELQDSTNVTGALGVTGNATIQGGTSTIGTTAQQGSLVLHDGNGQTATISVGSALVANTALAIPTGVGATDTFCMVTIANCLGTAFVQNGNSFGAPAVLGTNDSNSLSFETNTVTQATIAVGGATSFQNSANSATAFRVLNSSAVPQFVVDTTNSLVYIGDPVSDTTGALLVLDSKSNAGDPTGVLGGMYYNANFGTYRCFEQDVSTTGYWRDCLQNVRSSFYYSNEFLTTASDSDIRFNSDSGGGYDDGRDPEAGRPGIIRSGTGTGTNGWIFTGANTDNATDIIFGNNNYWRYDTAIIIPTSSALSAVGQRYTLRIGFHENEAVDGADGCFFKYSDNVNSGIWQGVCINNSTPTTCNTTVTVATNTWYRLTISANAAGTSVDFQINGVSRCQVAASIPTATTRATSWGNSMYKDSGSTDRWIDQDFVEIQAQLGAAR